MAKAFDLPGWPCPPRLADIPEHKGSYGWVSPQAVLVDDEGELFVDGLTVPQPRPDALQGAAIVAWCEDGIALYVPREGYAWFHRNKSMAPHYRSLRETYWLPVARVLEEPPEFAAPV